MDDVLLILNYNYIVQITYGCDYSKDYDSFANAKNLCHRWVILEYTVQLLTSSEAFVLVIEEENIALIFPNK